MTVEFRNPIWWRLKKQFYELQGSECPDCGKISFPPREICRECNSQINSQPEATGTITAIFESAENKHDRNVEVTYAENGDCRKLIFNLNGKNHMASLQINMRAKIFSRRSSKQKDPILSLELISSTSK